MKKLAKLLIALVLALSLAMLASCGDEEDPTDDKIKDGLEGPWVDYNP